MKIEQGWLQQTIEELIKRFNIPSMQVAIVQEGKVICAGSGVREVEKMTLANEDTIYSIASITKTFVAAGASVLVDDGIITWDEPILRYLPDFKMYNESLTQNVTMRDLLSHRTGIPRHDKSWSLRRDQLKLTDIIKNISFLEPSQPLRHIAQYNNYMFALAAYIIEQLTGKAWDEFITDRLLKPLNMNNTFFRKKNILEHTNRARGYQTTANKTVAVPYGDIYFMGGAGCISSSISDMSKWVQFHLNEGRIGDLQLISKKTIKELVTPIVAKEVIPWIHFPEFSDHSYGICWSISYYKGHKIVSKSGGLDGFLSDLSIIPELDFGIISLTNGINHMAIPILENMIYDKLYGLADSKWADRYEEEFKKFRNIAKENFAKEKARVDHNSIPRDLQDYIGKYNHPAYGDYVVSQKGQKLMLTYRRNLVAISHVIADNFMLIIESSNQAIPLQFHASLKGSIQGLSIGLESKISKGILFKKQV